MTIPIRSLGTVASAGVAAILAFSAGPATAATTYVAPTFHGNGMAQAFFDPHLAGASPTDGRLIAYYISRTSTAMHYTQKIGRLDPLRQITATLQRRWAGGLVIDAGAHQMFLATTLNSTNAVQTQVQCMIVGPTGISGKADTVGISATRDLVHQTVTINVPLADLTACGIGTGHSYKIFGVSMLGVGDNATSGVMEAAFKTVWAR